MCGVNVGAILTRDLRVPAMDGHVNEGNVVYLFVADDIVGSIDNIDHQLVLHQVVEGASEE